MEKGIPTGLSRPELRKFGLQVGAGFLVLAGIAWWRGHTVTPRLLAAIGGALVVFGAVTPAALGPVHTAWGGAAKVLSKVTTPVFLGIVYFLIFTPAGAVRRALGKDSVQRKPLGGSYFLKRKHRVSSGMDHQF